LGTGGTISEQGIVEALYIGEFLGLILMWWGFAMCTKAPKPIVGVDSNPEIVSE